MNIVSTIKRYEIVENDQDLAPTQMSKNFIYTLERDALEYFTWFWKPNKLYEEVKHRAQLAYNSPAM